MMFFYYREKTDIQYQQKNPLQVQLHYKLQVYKRTSLFASNRGSMTVEAAVILPVLICALMGILLWGKVFLVNQTMETALLETGRQLARKEYMLSDQGTEGSSIYTARVCFQKNQKQGNAAGGVEITGLNFVGSEYDKQTKEIHLRIQYKVRIPLFLLGTWQIRIKGGINQKAWNGYAPSDGRGTTGNQDYVYVTEDGNVYHQDGQCYHLHITVHETEDVTPYYNGKTKYRPCEHCINKKDGRTDTLYIPEEGDCYHSDPSCSGLTRTVHYVKKDEIGTMRPCSHCSR